MKPTVALLLLVAAAVAVSSAGAHHSASKKLLRKLLVHCLYGKGSQGDIFKKTMFHETAPNEDVTFLRPYLISDPPFFKYEDCLELATDAVPLVKQKKMKASDLCTLGMTAANDMKNAGMNPFSEH